MFDRCQHVSLCGCHLTLNSLTAWACGNPGELQNQSDREPQKEGISMVQIISKEKMYKVHYAFLKRKITQTELIKFFNEARLRASLQKDMIKKLT